MSRLVRRVHSSKLTTTTKNANSVACGRLVLAMTLLVDSTPPKIKKSLARLPSNQSSSRTLPPLQPNKKTNSTNSANSVACGPSWQQHSWWTLLRQNQKKPHEIVVKTDVNPELGVHSSQIKNKCIKQRKLRRLRLVLTTMLLVDSSPPTIKNKPGEIVIKQNVKTSSRTSGPLQPTYKKRQENAQTPLLAIGLGDDALGGLFSTKTKKSLARSSSNQTSIQNFTSTPAK